VAEQTCDKPCYFYQKGHGFFCFKEKKMNKKADNTDVIVQNPLINSSVEKMILVIRDKQVLLDRDLATLYGVETRAINQAVKRNQERFPERNCFMLNKDEIPESLKSQVGMRTKSWTQLENPHNVVLQRR
jgi:hypothetical protein